jgi:hypothetical protein
MYVVIKKSENQKIRKSENQSKKRCGFLHPDSEVLPIRDFFWTCLQIKNEIIRYNLYLIIF